MYCYNISSANVNKQNDLYKVDTTYVIICDKRNKADLPYISIAVTNPNFAFTILCY